MDTRFVTAAMLEDRSCGELVAGQGVDIVAVSSVVRGGSWLWTPKALKKDGWRDMGSGLWTPVPAEERGEWTIPIRGAHGHDMASSVGNEHTDIHRGASPGVRREKELAAAWVDAWSGPDGWLRRHAARMEAVGRAIRMSARQAAAFGKSEEEAMAKAKGGGLVLSAAARKALSARAAAVELTPERYVELLFTSGAAAPVLDNLVDRAVMARVAARRKTAETAAAAERQSQPGGGRQQAAGQGRPPRPAGGA